MPNPTKNFKNRRVLKNNIDGINNKNLPKSSFTGNIFDNNKSSSLLTLSQLLVQNARI